MLPYYALLLVVVGLVGVGQLVRTGPGGLDRERWDPLWDTLPVAVLVAFATFRVGVGTDYDRYVDIFTNRLDPAYWSYWSANNPQDWGFTQLQLSLLTFTHNPQVLFLVAAIGSVVPAWFAIRRRSLAPVLAMYLYVCLGSYLLPLNVVRQGLAAGILFFAAVMFLDRRRWVYVVLAVLATMMHASAGPVAVVLYLARNWRPRPVVAAAVLAVASLIAYYLTSFEFALRFTGEINDRYSTYEAVETGIGTYLVIAAKGALIAWCYRYRDLLSDRDRRYLLYATFGLAALIVGTQQLVIARLDIYFSLFLVLALPNAIAASRDRLLAVAAWGGGLIYLGFFIANYGGLLPYELAF